MLIALNDMDVVAGCGKKQAERGTEEESVRRAVIHTFIRSYKKRTVVITVLFLRLCFKCTFYKVYSKIFPFIRKHFRHIERTGRVEKLFAGYITFRGFYDF